MPEPALKREFDYYRAHQAELVEKYNGKHVVIRSESVIGVFDRELDAIRNVSKIYPPGTFLVQKVEPGDKSFTQTFHSRVSFA